jgi:hypothetical protein
MPLIGRMLLLALAGMLVMLVPLAHASPPDATWIAGLYDDGDLDSVAFSIMSTCAVAGADPPAADDADTLIVSIPLVDEQAADSPASSSPHPRAPPAR